MVQIVLSTTFCALLCGLFVSPASAISAFPGAEGFGTNTKGGRDGTVMNITTTHDSGKGSLRACIESTSPRICVFQIGGTINLNKNLDIRNPYITIAGQTAPGDGITIRGNGHGMYIWTHDVIVQHVRLRRGSGGAGDTIWSREGAHNVVIDHCSLSWATDENLSITNGAHHITYSWNIISEGLALSTNPKGEHSMGTLIDRASYISLHHNLYAHHNVRHPRVSDNGNVEFINNVVYNWREMGSQISSGGLFLPSYGNFIGNYYIPGPDHIGISPISVRQHTHPLSRLYVKGNIGPGRQHDLIDDWGIVSGSSSMYRSSSPVSELSNISTQPAEQAYSYVTNFAGATLPKRDEIDTRIIQDTKNKTGKIINDPSEVGGWLAADPGTPSIDTDDDGIPDVWEISQGLDPTKNDSSLYAHASSYTNIERYIHSLTSVPAPLPSPSLPPTCTKKQQGDANCDDMVSLQDFSIWRTEFYAETPTLHADFNTDAKISLSDFEIWRRNFR